MEECVRQRRQLAAELQKYQKVFIALGDETRQLIYAALLSSERIGMRVPEITERTHLSRPAVSHHLRILKDAGLICLHRVGTMNYYYANADQKYWSGMKELVDHVEAAVTSAAAHGYPRLKEDERP